jgi:hypothetical protein
MKRLRSLLLLVALSVGACSSLHTSLPLTDVPPPATLSSTVFAGHARAFRFVHGDWTADPGNDYDLFVIERRFPDRWEVVKEIHRRNPSYDGRAGPRDQTLYFVVRTSPAADGGLDLTVEGTLGAGKGHEEARSSGLVLELAAAEKGWLVPFDTIRIRQIRGTQSGRFEEIVELFSRREGREIPFMKFEEEGTIYQPIAP